MKIGGITRTHWIGLLYGVSGCAGLIYETVWIRAFALSFGNTLLAFSTVISIFLGGMAAGAACGGRVKSSRPLLLYGYAELWIALYALSIPSLLSVSPRWLSPLYGTAGTTLAMSFARGVLCALILLPATVPMGASLPWLLAAARAAGQAGYKLTWVYALNTLGGALGAILCGFVLLPAAGYGGTLALASSADAAAGLAALWLARGMASLATAASEKSRPVKLETDLSGTRLIWLVGCTSGLTAMVYEVASARIAALLFGPTAVTVALTLAAVLAGLAAGAVVASRLPRSTRTSLAGSQLAAAICLLALSCAIAAAPVWLAARIQATGGSALGMEWLEAVLVFSALTPLMLATGMALPLAMSALERTAQSAATKMGWVYGVNTAGCIAGALLTGWFLVPRFGAERTLYLGALANVALGMLLLRRFRWRAAAGALAFAAALLFAYPQWDMAAITAGAYKYAPYYGGSTTEALHAGQLKFLREGSAGTVTVRQVDRSRVLAIDGKVDATDGGGDLLTEKLLAHLPLSLVSDPRYVCVIGLASGVTAGSALTYPLTRLDVVELSREVVEASHLFDGVNGRPLASSRTRLIVNDGRNHLALTPERYDAILSEPSNPWIAGMNALFTEEFFRIARARLKPGGVLAQWFHLYNMAPDDLRSLVRSFTQVFPSATLWQLNEGDVLLTGYADDSVPAFRHTSLPAPAQADLTQIGIGRGDVVPTLYLMHGADLIRFAGNAARNTDDRPVLEFHGRRNLDLQTSESNTRDLAMFPRRMPPPPFVLSLDQETTAERMIARGTMFEKAESFGFAFASYKQAFASRPGETAALAGMLRCAKTEEEIASAGTLASRTKQAIDCARNGNFTAAERLLYTLTQAWPDRPEPQLNYGLFCFERSQYQDAIAAFRRALKRDPQYVPALEAMAKTYLRIGDLANAARWSRRILDVNPEHPAAREVLSALEQQGVNSH